MRDDWQDTVLLLLGPDLSLPYLLLLVGQTRGRGEGDGEHCNDDGGAWSVSVSRLARHAGELHAQRAELQGHRLE